MPEEFTPKTSKEVLKEISRNYDQELRSAHENGKLVAWCSALVPQEFLSTMGILAAFPENHAASVAAKGLAAPFVTFAESLGYKSDICSYARVNIAISHILRGDAYQEGATQEMLDAYAKLPALPRPDMIIVTNNSCTVVPKWYGAMAEYFHVPFICIETAAAWKEEIEESRIEYVKEQFQSLISQLETICGKPFDYDYFKVIMEKSVRNAKQWIKVLNYAHYVPSPIDGFNYFNYMSVMVTERAKDSTYELYKLIESEMEQLVKEGKSQFKGEEKYRIQWEGIACWPYLGHNVKFLREHGVNFVSSPYPWSWYLEYTPGDIDGLAKVYLNIYTNRGWEYNVQMRTKLAEDSHADGIICHANKSCRVNILMQYTVLDEVSERTHLPVVFFDGDQCDPYLFSKAQYETRVESLVESMKAAKEARAGK